MALSIKCSVVLNGKAYFFMEGGQYVRYNMETDRADSGYPKLVSENWNGVWPAGPDAAVVWNNGKAYFFKGNEYLRLDAATRAVDAGYPKPIAGQWDTLWASGVDAAVMWNNGKAYFFKGSEYIRYDVATDKVDAGYPRPIAGNWPGLWSSGVDTAVMWNNGKAYFFKGSQYIRYDVAADKADAGYPKAIASSWPGLVEPIAYSYSYYVNGVPDIDQKWNSVPGSGSMYCVPTSTTNWFYYLQRRGIALGMSGASVDPTSAAFPPLVTSDLIRVGSAMDTGAESGTSFDDWFDGVEDWFEDYGVFACLLGLTYTDGAAITFAMLRTCANMGGLITAIRGRYTLDDGEYERASAHALTVVGLRESAFGYEIVLHDPNQDEAKNDLDKQSAVKDMVIFPREVSGNFEGEQTTLLRWDTGTDPYRFLDKFLAILPLFAVTNATAGSLTAYWTSLTSSAIDTRQIPLPFSGKLLDFAIHPLHPTAACIGEGTGDVWVLDLAAGASRRLARMTAPGLLTYGGRTPRLYVAQEREVIVLDEGGAVVARADMGVPIEAISFDHNANRLAVASASQKKLLYLSPDLRSSQTHALPELPAEGRLSLSTNAKDGTLFVTREGSAVVATLRIHPTGAVAMGTSRLLTSGRTSAAHVDRRGRLHVSEAGRISVFDADGNRLERAPFQGLPAGPLLKIARSYRNSDPVKMREPQWRDGR